MPFKGTLAAEEERTQERIPTFTVKHNKAATKAVDAHTAMLYTLVVAPVVSMCVGGVCGCAGKHRCNADR